MRSFISFFCILILFGLASCSRFFHLQADPPAGEISDSGAFLTDEGIYSQNAIQWSRTGKWHLDEELNPGAVMPVFMVYQFGLMQIFGVHLWSVRVGGILCGLLNLLFIFVFLRKEDPTLAKIVLILGAVNFPLIIYNRLAFAENLLLCLLIGMVICLKNMTQAKQPVLWTIVFWFLSGVAFLTKPLHLFMIIPFLIELFLVNPIQKRKIIFASVAAFSLVCVGIFIFTYPYVEAWHYFYQLNLVTHFSSGFRIYIWKVVVSLFENPLFRMMPILFVIAIWKSFHYFSNFIRKKEIGLIERIFSIYYLSGFLFLVVIPYAPVRYWLVLIPPILILNGLFFREAIQHSSITFFRNKRIMVLIVLFILAQICTSFYHWISADTKSIVSFYGLLSIIPLVYLSQKRLKSRSVVITLIGIIFALHLFQITRYHTAPHYSMKRMIETVNQVLERDSRRNSKSLAGDMVSVMAFNTDVSVIDVMYKKDQLLERMLKRKPGYLLLEDVHLFKSVKSLIADHVLHFELIREFQLMRNYHQGYPALLFKIHWK